MIDLVKIRKHDPLKRNVEKGDHEEGMSPFDPPDARKPPGEGLAVAKDEMHPFLQKFREEHESYKAYLEDFERTLVYLETEGMDEQSDLGLQRFFGFLEDEVIPHNKREEKVLFPLLAHRLRISGEHSKGPKPTTAVDVLEDEHLNMVQLSAVVLNFFALASRLKDEGSRNYVLKTAIDHGRQLAEMLDLHIFREDDVVFSLAHNLITHGEFDELVAHAQGKTVSHDHGHDHGHGHDHHHGHDHDHQHGPDCDHDH